MSEERDQLKALTEELGRELHQSKAQVGELRTETEYLNTQLEVQLYTTHTHTHTHTHTQHSMYVLVCYYSVLCTIQIGFVCMYIYVYVCF